MAKYYCVVALDNDQYLLPGWEVISRDPNTGTIIVDGFILTDTEEKRMMLELPQKLIRYPISKKELKQKICSADYRKIIYVNDKSVTTSDAVDLVDKAKGDFIVMKENPYIVVSFGFNDSIVVRID